MAHAGRLRGSFEAPIQQHQAAALEIEFQQASGQAVLAYKVTAVIRWCPGHGQEIGLRDKDPQLPTPATLEGVKLRRTQRRASHRPFSSPKYGTLHAGKHGGKGVPVQVGKVERQILGRVSINNAFSA